MAKMEKPRFFTAMLAGKAVSRLLRLFGKRATHLPGEIALAVCGDFFRQMEKPKTLICVTGTNGKTTTSNLIASLLRGAGYSVTNNSLGSNTAAGIAAALLQNATLTGRPKNDYAVIEVDERSSLQFYPFMAPDYLVCTNIMPDSIMRNAHTDFISYIINTAVPSTTKVLLNADDILCAQLARQCPARIFYGVSAEAPPAPADDSLKNLYYCPECGARMKADYLRYEHIGRVRCTACSFGSPTPDYTVTEINRKYGFFTLRHQEQEAHYTIVNDNIVNIYNTSAAVSLFAEMGFPAAKTDSLLQQAEIVKDRYEQIIAGDLRVTMILAKGLNAVAVGSVFRYVASRPGDNKCLLLLIDDREYNDHDSEICCWLYDLDYGPLKDDSIKKIIFAGKRCLDHRLRTTMSGLDQEKILYRDAVRNSADLVDTTAFHDVYVLYSAYFIKEAMREKDRLLRKGKNGK